MSFGATRPLRIESDVERTLLVIGHEAAAQDRCGGGLGLRRRKQEAFAVRSLVGLQVLDPRIAADVETGGLSGAHLLEAAIGPRGDPCVEAIRERIERRPERDVELAHAARRKKVEAQFHGAEIARLREQVFHRIRQMIRAPAMPGLLFQAAAAQRACCATCSPSVARPVIEGIETLASSLCVCTVNIASFSSTAST